MFILLRIRDDFLAENLTLLVSPRLLISPLDDSQLLDLSRNQLNGFDDVLTVKLRRIRDVRLENNPLICDRCHMGSLIDIARTVS